MGHIGVQLSCSVNVHVVKIDSARFGWLIYIHVVGNFVNRRSLETVV
jgi:hypothetical protein